MDWGSAFWYGAYRGYTVKKVFRVRPSYLMWTCVYTDNRFSPRVMLDLVEAASTRPWRGMNVGLAKDFVQKFGLPPGPW